MGLLTILNDLYLLFFTYVIGYTEFQIVILFSLAKQLWESISGRSVVDQNKKKGYGDILEGQKCFFCFNILSRGIDNWSRPINSRPDRVISVMKRNKHDARSRLTETLKKPQEVIKCLNFGSYNYLGFSKPPKEVEEKVFECLKEYGVSSCSSHRYGQNNLLRKLEHTVASFVGKEDAVIVGMGYATNSMIISNLVGEGDLVLSDYLSHMSTRMGIRHSASTFKNFKHNDMKDLERIIVQYISKGQPGSTRDHIIPWKRIWVMFEGIYSMEGEFCNLTELVRLKKKYGLYLYMDEAHSMGGTGASGKGCCDVFNIAPSEVDVLMGTFTKAFGSIGGYVAATERVCSYLREKSFASLYGTVLPPVCMSQVIEVMRLLEGEEGKRRLQRQKEMSIRLYEGLKKLGYKTILEKNEGDGVSPIVCVYLINMAKCFAFGRICLKMGLAVAIAGYPAVPLCGGRARFCISAQHTKQDIDNCLEILDFLGDRLLVKYDLPVYKKILKLLF